MRWPAGIAALLAAPSVVAECAPGHNLPDGPIRGAYTGSAKPEEILRAVDDGVNVIIWSFITFTSAVKGGPSADRVARVHEGLRSKGLCVPQLMSIGGWDAPHPNTARSGREWWSAFTEWNAEFAANVTRNITDGSVWSGFDGVDWDTEGQDNKTSPDNQFSPDLITLMGTFMQAAKGDGYITSMVPAQSYLDVGTSEFAWDLLHADSWEPTFTYHGRNNYAPLLALYSESFDLVIVQIYEGWSRSGYHVHSGSVGPEQEISQLGTNYSRGWTVDFNGAMGLRSQQVRVPPQKLLIGLANGWALSSNKSLYVSGEDAGKGYHHVGADALRGFAYWVIAEDSPDVALAANLKKYM